MTQTNAAVGGHFTWLGIALIVFGIAAILTPAAAGSAVAVVIGLILLAAGVAAAIRGLQAATGMEKVLGLCKVVVSFRFRPASGWLWLLISGGVSLVLGVLIWSQWPMSGLWAVGVLVGLNLISTGFALKSVSMLREIAARVASRNAATMSFAFWSLVVAGLSPSCVIAQDISDEWQFAATIYGWFPDIGGNTEFATGAGSSIDVDINTILDHLKMTGQGAFEIQKGHWGAFTDVVYLDVGDSTSRTRGLEIGDQPLPGSIQAHADFDLKSVIWTLAGSYRTVASPAATVDWLAGARLTSIKQDLSWQFTGTFGPIAPPPLTGSRKAKVDQWDAIVGMKGRFGFGADHNWVMPFYFDVGAGDSDLTWQAMLGFGYAFGWGDLGVAWRYLDYDLQSDGPIRELNFNGPALGATFRW